jgi:hypothetical protein
MSTATLPAHSTPLSMNALVEGAPITVSLEWITAAMAGEYLNHNTHNRNLKKNLHGYARDMVEGDWTFTGAPITFSWDGLLLDGQNRLHAIIEANEVKPGISIPTLVVRGLFREAQDDIDRNVPRKFGDVLKLRGEEYPPQLAALTRIVGAWLRGHRKSVLNSGGDGAPTDAELLRVLEQHPELRTYANHASANIGKAVAVPGSIIGFTWWLFDQIDSDDASHFFSRLADDTGHHKGEPIYELRRTLLTVNANARAERSRLWLLVIIIKAWNAYRDGETVSLYRWRPGGANPEKFPEPR